MLVVVDTCVTGATSDFIVFGSAVLVLGASVKAGGVAAGIVVDGIVLVLAGAGGSCDLAAGATVCVFTVDVVTVVAVFAGASTTEVTPAAAGGTVCVFTVDVVTVVAVFAGVSAADVVLLVVEVVVAVVLGSATLAGVLVTAVSAG